MSSKPQKNRLPRIHIKWDRRRSWHPDADINKALKRPVAYINIGGKGAGKSSLAEALAFHYPKVIDLFGSRDNEALGWLRSPLKDSVLFLKGNSVEIDCRCADVINATDVTLKDFEKHKVILSCSAFFGSLDEEWHSLQKIMDKLWNRGHWSEAWCVVIREAANLIYSRIGLGENQFQAKAYLVYVMREMRHLGLALALDTLRTYSIDADVRFLADFIFIKALGLEGLSDDLHFVYRYYRPNSLMKLKEDEFVVLSRHGPMGVGWFDYPFWHKEEHEDLLNHFGIRVHYGEIPHIPSAGSHQVGDHEHARIIKARMETDDGMETLGQKLSRSSKTIYDHIRQHNNCVRTLKECDSCARVKGEYKNTVTR